MIKKGSISAILIMALLFLILFSVQAPMDVFASSSTYYVHNNTDFNNLNNYTFGPGDHIIFDSGGTFSGSVVLHGSGASGNPVVLDSSNPSGTKPIISFSGSTNDSAINLNNLSYYTIQNLEIQSSVVDMNGITIKGSNGDVTTFNINNCKFDNFTRSDTTHNSYGIVAGAWASTGYNIYNVVVNNCEFCNSDNGAVFLNKVNNSIVQNCNFHDLTDCGFFCWAQDSGANNNHNITVQNSTFTRVTTNTDNGGWSPVWFHAVDNGIIQNCEVSGTTPGSWDRQCVDLEYATNSTYQYCYFHDNASFMDMCPTNNNNNTVRYCISYNEGGCYDEQNTGSDNGFNFYNNTLVNVKNTTDDANARPDNLMCPNMVVKNNIFYMNPGATMSYSGSGLSASNNCFYNQNPPAGESGSFQADPQFVNINDLPNGLQLSSTSPCAGAGAIISNNGGRDYWGNTLYNGNPDIGANETGYQASTLNGNLVSNPGFESGTANWTMQGNTGIDTANAHSGSNCIKTGIGSGGCGQYITTGYTIGQNLTLSGYGKIDGTTDTGNIGIDCQDTNGNKISGCTILFNSTSYSLQSNSITVPAGTARLYLWTWKNGSTNNAYYDDISIQSSSTPPPNGNLVSNPGFESGTANWTMQGNTGIDTTNANSGYNCIKTGIGSGGCCQYITTGFTTGQNLTLSGYGKIDGATDTGNIGVDCQDANGNKISGCAISFNSTSYSLQSNSIIVPVGTARLYLWIWKNGNTNNAYYDDISIQCGGGGGSNLVQDPGFENQNSGTISSPWVTEGADGKGIDIGLGFAHSGSNNAWIRTSTNNDWNAITQSVNVIAGKNYTLTGWIQNSNNIPANKGYFGVRHPDGSVLQEISYTGCPNYTQFTVNFTAAESSVTVFGGFWSTGTDIWVRFDDISLVLTN